MDFLDLNFLKFGIIDLIDIILVGFLIYQIYQLVRGTIAVNIFIGLFSIYIIWLFVKSLNMFLLSAILDKVIGVGVIALMIVFQQEIRRFLLLIGRNTLSNSSWWRFFFHNTTVEKSNLMKIKPLVEACKSLAAGHTGALIIIAKTYEEQVFTSNGEILNARISRRLLESIFTKTSPLHDGAVIIADNVIKAASCILPLSENTSLPSQLGLRHRAAVGITEQSDAVAIIISEESGFISYAYKGKIKTNISTAVLEKNLARDFE